MYERDRRSNLPKSLPPNWIFCRKWLIEYLGLPL